MLDGASNRKTFIQLTERQFSAELYHNWRKKIAASKNRYSNLKIGFEVSKKFITNKLVQNKSSFTPDLVLHQSQVSFDPNFQKIYLEIKTNPRLSLKRIKHDLNKILFAINQYGYQNGVFMSVNSDKERLIRIIKSYMVKNKFQNSKIQNYERFYVSKLLYSSRE